MRMDEFRKQAYLRCCDHRSLAGDHLLDPAAGHELGTALRRHVGQHLAHFTGIDTGVLGHPHPSQDILGVYIRMELLDLIRSYQVTLHSGGSVGTCSPAMSGL